MHFSTRLPGGFWTVEVRQPGAVASLPYHRRARGDDVRAAGRWNDHAAGSVPARRSDRRSLAPVDRGGAASVRRRPVSRRAWLSDSLRLREAIVAGLDVSDRVRDRAGQRGDAVGRAAVHARARDAARSRRGVEIAPLLLHTGVASLENHEPPYEEYYRVPRQTADRVNAARRAGNRVIAVGTTVVRALETVTDASGTTVSWGGLDGSRGHRRSSAAVGKRLDLRVSRTARHASVAPREREWPTSPRARVPRGATARISLARIRRFTLDSRARY